jgi:hypothetical protein
MPAPMCVPCMRPCCHRQAHTQHGIPLITQVCSVGPHPPRACDTVCLHGAVINYRLLSRHPMDTAQPERHVRCTVLQSLAVHQVVDDDANEERSSHRVIISCPVQRHLSPWPYTASACLDPSLNWCRNAAIQLQLPMISAGARHMCILKAA